MAKLRPPGELDFTDSQSLADPWFNWKQEMKLYLKLAMKEDKEEDKYAAFLYLIGRKGREIFNTWTILGTDKNKI